MATKPKTSTATRKPRAPRAKAKRPIFDIGMASSRRVNAHYDISRTTDENENLWKHVDGLSAAEANSPAVRKVIRERARYEVANNSYASGIVDTLAADTIGPVVQLQLGDSDTAQRTERAFSSWAKAVNLWAKLRTMNRAKTVDGESFGMLVTNRKVINPVKLDVRLIETEMITSWTGMQKDSEIDGIRFDGDGNPIEYRILKVHPGDYRSFLKSVKGEWIRAEYMLHYFRAVRAGQVRGVSEITPALSLFGELRSFTKAVINSATRAAEIAGVMQTTNLPEEETAQFTDPLTMMEAVRNNLIALPDGWEMNQFKAEQPATTYEMFKRAIISEAARCVSMPYNIAAGDSSSYNYASGRLDHQTYDRGIEVDREEARHDVLDRVYAAWLSEYRITANLTAAQVVELSDHEWYFTSRDHVDPKKESDADHTRLGDGTLTYSRYWAKRGADWKRENAQWIKERIEAETAWNKARADAGLPTAPYPCTEAQSQTLEVIEPPDEEPKK